jgi:hypothetical protein
MPEQNVPLRNPPFMRKPSDAEGCLKWLVTWANCGHGEADQVRGSAYLKGCQKKLRSWLDQIVRTNDLHDPPTDSVLDEIDAALEDCQIVVVPTVRSPWYKPVSIRNPLYCSPDAMARLGLMMGTVISAGLERRVSKCGLKGCELFIYSPGPKRLKRYCSERHRKRHHRRG